MFSVDYLLIAAITLHRSLKAELHIANWFALPLNARGLFDRLALGSTAERLLDQLSCDVVIAKAHDFISPLKV